MTKKELAVRIAAASGGSQAKATDQIDLVMTAIKAALEAGEEVTIRGFGAWRPVTTAPRSGRNLRSGERVVIPSKKRIKFQSYMSEEEV